MFEDLLFDESVLDNEIETEEVLEEEVEFEFIEEDCEVFEESSEDLLLANSLFLSEALVLKEEEDAGRLIKKINKEESAKIIKAKVAKMKLKKGWKWATSITPEIKKLAKSQRVQTKLGSLGLNTVDCMMIGGYAVMVYYGYRGIFKYGEVIAVKEREGKKDKIKMQHSVAKGLSVKLVRITLK